MNTRGITFSIVLVIALALTAGLLALVFSNFIDFSRAPNPAASSPAVGQSAGGGAYNPPSLDAAPDNIRDAVKLGYDLMNNTPKLLPDYVGNDMNCTNCHFNGGLTEGGKNNGISLAGVTAVYPKFRSRQNYAVDMVTRVNDCFLRSENGKPLPADSKEMTAMLTYLQWIAKGIPIYADVPWLGLPAVNSQHKADAAAGKTVFTSYCAACHGTDGLGTTSAPPLWGDKSYNDGAGMAKPATLAAFALLNMPRDNPILTPEQALDVGEYVDTQPRPKFQQ